MQQPFSSGIVNGLLDLAHARTTVPWHLCAVASTVLTAAALADAIFYSLTFTLSSPVTALRRTLLYFPRARKAAQRLPESDLRTLALNSYASIKIFLFGGVAVFWNPRSAVDFYDRSGLERRTEVRSVVFSRYLAAQHAIYQWKKRYPYETRFLTSLLVIAFTYQVAERLFRQPASSGNGPSGFTDKPKWFQEEPQCGMEEGPSPETRVPVPVRPLGEAPPQAMPNDDLEWDDPKNQVMIDGEAKILTDRERFLLRLTQRMTRAYNTKWYGAPPKTWLLSLFLGYSVSRYCIHKVEAKILSNPARYPTKGYFQKVRARALASADLSLAAAFAPFSLAYRCGLYAMGRFTR